MAKTKKPAEPVQEEPVQAPKVDESVNSPEAESEKTEVSEDETETPEPELNEQPAEESEPEVAEEDEAKKFADETLAKARALRKR